MQRDMELVREILLEVESLPFSGGWHDINIAGRSEEEIVYHVLLLHEAGLIQAQNLTTHGGIDWKPKRLTNARHEFLDAARSETVWKRAKEMLAQAAGTVTLEGLKLALPQALKSMLS